jgi:hypothetical protein
VEEQAGFDAADRPVRVHPILSQEHGDLRVSDQGLNPPVERIKGFIREAL